MGQRKASGAGSYIVLVLSVVFVAACGAVFWLAYTGELGNVIGRLTGGASTEETTGSGTEAQTDPEPKDFASYSWDEVAQIAKLIEGAGSDGEGFAVAQRYGILSSDGSLNDCVRQVVLTDGSAALCRVVGVLADDRADGSGKCGLTFILSGLGSSEMNAADTCEGGWSGSELRGWLNSEGLALLPDELRENVAAAAKLSNNTGITSDVSAVTATSDSLWLFSASEIYGELTWFEQEYGDGAGYHTDYTNFGPYTQMINSEGSQYLYFKQNGVADRSEYAAVSTVFGELTSNFWLRTCYPLSMGSDAGQFYQVMASGYPSTVALASQKNKILAGFCL